MVEHRLATGESLSADLIAQRGFTTNRKGFDPGEVKTFLASVADTVRDLREQLRTSETARRDAEQRALHPKIDEEMLLQAVGEETASILRTARVAAGDIRTKAEDQATALLHDAQARAESLGADADASALRVATEADESASAQLTKAAEDADRIRAAARHEAETVRHQADQDRKMTVEAAQQIREQILSDLSRRRRVANTQIEQLRAGRERLLEAYLVVRRTLDEVTDELQRADGEARAAADEVAKRAAERPSDDFLLDLTPGSSPPPGTSVSPIDSRPVAESQDEPTIQFDALVFDDAAPSGTDPEVTAPTPVVSGLAPPVRPDAEPSGSGSERGSAEPTTTDSHGSTPELAEAGVAGSGVSGSVDGWAGTPQSVLSQPGVSRPGVSQPGVSQLPVTPTTVPQFGGSEVVQGAAVSSTAVLSDGSASGGDSAPLPGSGSSRAGGQGASVAAERSAPGAVAGSGQGSQVLEAPDEVESVRVVANGAVASTRRAERPKSPARRGPGSSRGPVAKASPEQVDTAEPQAVDEAPVVESIFARIRADRAESLVKARSVLDGAASDSATLDEEAEADFEPLGSAPEQLLEKAPSETASSETASSETAPLETPVSETVPPEAVSPELTGPETAGADEESPIPDGDEGILQQRDEATADIEVALARRLKRALQDEQNDLLDRLRQVRGTPKAGSLLPKPADQRSRYTAASRPQLEAAATAGVAFAAGLGPTSPPAASNIDDLAVTLAAAIADPLRRRLQQAFAESAGDEQSVLIEAVGAAYRECKTQRIEQLAGDHVAAAFSRGAFEATPEGVKLRWLVEDLDGPCPDCDDNVLAGGLPKGDDFPTGQQYPPAHAGCRCVLVPTDE